MVEYLRFFLAGVEFAYAQQPWQENGRGLFLYDPRTPLDAYVAKPRDWPEKGEVKLAITAQGMAWYLFSKATGHQRRKKVGDKTWVLNHKEIAFVMGAEEGRHLAQMFIPELRAVLAGGTRAENTPNPTHGQLNAPGADIQKLKEGNAPEEQEVEEFLTTRRAALMLAYARCTENLGESQPRSR